MRWKGSLDERDGADDRGQCVGDGGHELDEDVQRHAHHVLAGVADGVAGNGGLVGGGAFAVTGDVLALDVLLGVVESPAGVAHEDGPGDSNDGSAHQNAAHELHAEHKPAENGDEQGDDGGHDHLANGLLGRQTDHLVVVGLDSPLQHAGDGHHLIALVGHDLGRINGVVGEHGGEIFHQRAAQDTAGDHGEGGEVEDRHSTGGVCAHIGHDEGHGGESRRADGKALADGGGGVADGVQLIGDLAHVVGQVAGLRQAPGVVGDGPEGVDGHRGAHEGQHPEGGDGDAVGPAQEPGD